VDSTGAVRDLPAGAIVTSRASTPRGEKKSHFALICHSDIPLCVADYGAFEPSQYRNYSETAGPVGASQVTALLKRDGKGVADEKYRVNLRARLVDSYWVRLIDPVLLSTETLSVLARDLRHICSDWIEFAQSLRAPPSSPNEDSQALRLQL
jgi:hypothetical protein